MRLQDEAMVMMTIASVQDQVRALQWTHTIDLGGGIVTPGRWPPSVLVRKALEGIDFRGKKVLDIGCWDGLWSFEAERRGAAKVYATDYTAHRPLRESGTFCLAHRILGSQARYEPNLSVYDVERLGVTDFDIVLFLGVYYHLKDPLLALARLRRVMRPGAILVVEGEVIDDDRANYARFYYHQRYRGDESNWWIPTVACLREWVECSCFAIDSLYNAVRDPLSGGRAEALKKLITRRVRRRGGRSRCILTARAVCREDPNYCFPDEHLAPFQRP
jgi:tRNA (mo5U34)-methyltransferase